MAGWVSCTSAGASLAWVVRSKSAQDSRRARAQAAAHISIEATNSMTPWPASTARRARLRGATAHTAAQTTAAMRAESPRLVSAPAQASNEKALHAHDARQHSTARASPTASPVCAKPPPASATRAEQGAATHAAVLHVRAWRPKVALLADARPSPRRQAHMTTIPTVGKASNAGSDVRKYQNVPVPHRAHSCRASAAPNLTARPFSPMPHPFFETPNPLPHTVPHPTRPAPPEHLSHVPPFAALTGGETAMHIPDSRKPPYQQTRGVLVALRRLSPRPLRRNRRPLINAAKPQRLSPPSRELP